MTRLKESRQKSLMMNPDLLPVPVSQGHHLAFLPKNHVILQSDSLSPILI